MVGDTCKAIVVYTGDLARIKPSQVAKSFIDKYCTQHYYGGDGRKNSLETNSSVSGQSGRVGPSNYEYLS
jgi:hypothetical protein